MSDESNPKNVASVWILVVLVGGLSVPFWRWNDSPTKRDEPLQWVEPNADPNGDERTAQSPTQHSLVSATSSSQPDQAAQLLQEFVNSDPGLQIQDAVKENQQRPGIPKQFQGEGIPLTDIKPWLPKPIGYDASPSEKQKLAGTVNGPIQAPASGTNPSGNPDSLAQSTSAQSSSAQSAWPDHGYQTRDSAIAPPTMYYRADPASNVASGTPSTNPVTSIPTDRTTPAQNSPGRMVSSSNSTPSDPPALFEAYPASPVADATPASQPRNGSQVKVTPSPAITPPTNPLRPGGNAPSSSRRPGTIISQPRPTSGQ
jgi:hypothetical protein